MNKTLLILACLYLTACELGSSYDPKVRIMYVDYYQEACDERSTSLCLRTRFDTDDAFEINSVSVSGFNNLQWGSRYTVQVEAERDSSGKDIHYSFESINSTQVIDASNNEFVLTFSMASGILFDNQNDSWTIAMDKTFVCSPSDCTLLAKSYRDNEKIQLRFSAENNELTLLGVACQSSEADFSTQCEGVNDGVWDIAHYRSDCGLFEPRLCLIYKEDADASTEWNILPFEVIDFTALWGQQYQLDVQIKIEAQDLKSVTFIKENDAARDKINESFKIIMRTGASGLEVSANDVIRYDDVEFNCDRNNQCRDIDDAIERANSSQERFLILQAVVETSGDTPVILIENLLCDAGADDFGAACVSDYDDVYWVE
jgi:hypothetical protein